MPESAFNYEPLGDVTNVASAAYSENSGHQPALKQSSRTGSRQASTTGSDKRSKWTLAMAINLPLFKSLCSTVTDKQLAVAIPRVVALLLGTTVTLTENAVHLFRNRQAGAGETACSTGPQAGLLRVATDVARAARDESIWPVDKRFGKMPSQETVLSWHRQAIKEMESMTPSLTVSAPTQPDYTATSGQKRRLSSHTGGSASKKVCNTAPRRLSAAKTPKSAAKTPNTAALPSGGRQPKADHIPALAPGGMAIVRDLKLSNAQTAIIGKLGHSETLALAKAFQCPFPTCAVEGLRVQYFVYDKQTKGTNYWMTCPHDTCPFKATKAGIAKCIQSATWT